MARGFRQVLGRVLGLRGLRRWASTGRPWRRRAVRGLGVLLLGSLLGGLALFALFLVVDAIAPFPAEALHRPPAVRVLGEGGEPLRFFLPADERWRFPVALDEISPDLVAAVIASEDRRFGRHPGVDPLALGRATLQNLRSGEVVSGASTLPMQIARMADPAPRTLGSKAREAFRALQLTWHHEPEELLALYLDLAPYGGNLEGVGAAAWFYFDKPPDRLSPGEIALLVALPRSPVAYDPIARPAAARRVRDRVLGQLVARGVFTEEQAAAGRRQPLPTERRKAPFLAPHLARDAARGRPGEVVVRTTLEPRTQGVAERQVERRIEELRLQGLDQAAVVVIDLETRGVRALVGSAGFFDDGRAGQVNGALAARSPGSTLKPFLLAQAIDRGLLVPESRVLDVPTDYAGYVAENYDGRYRGSVTAREALMASLNAPAVRLLAQVGLSRFHRLLVDGGLGTLESSPDRYGLPLILGAGEVRLLELTNLYAALGDGGRHRPVRLYGGSEAPGGAGAGGSPRGPGVRLVSPEAAWMVTQVLTEVSRPDLPAAWDLAVDVPAVAWKTGTSYGHRDAWAVGVSRRWAIGVWVGNFDGRPREGISGSEHAGPLLFDLFRALEPRATAPVGGPSLERPRNLRIAPVEVCALSRRLPTRACAERTPVEVVSGTTRLGTCHLHRRMLVDADSGELLTGDCLPGRRHGFAVLTRLEPELVAWWRAEGRPLPREVSEAPAWAPGCRGVGLGEAPRIVSPDPATPYRLRRGAPLEHQKIALQARVESDVRRLWWYRDGDLVAAAGPGERVWWQPERGRHRLVVTDDRGRSDGVEVVVE